MSKGFYYVLGNVSMFHYFGFEPDKKFYSLIGARKKISNFLKQYCDPVKCVGCDCWQIVWVPPQLKIRKNNHG